MFRTLQRIVFVPFMICLFVPGLFPFALLLMVVMIGLIAAQGLEEKRRSGRPPDQSEPR